MKYLLVGTLFCLPLLVTATPIDDKTVHVSTEDAEMNAAIAHAQATLDDFLKIVHSPPSGASDFKLKVRVTDEHGSEHFWITPFEQISKGFVGTVADDPEVVTSVSAGQRINFSRSDISDWGYSLNGKQVGSFTVCVLFKHMPTAEVQKYRNDYGFQC